MLIPCTTKELIAQRSMPLKKGQIDILIGTQMIAKGLDFPNVTLVGIINADVGLHIADFRAGERTFQLLTQVAGRAVAEKCSAKSSCKPIHLQALLFNLR